MVSAPMLPLEAHPAFHVASTSELAHVLEAQLAAELIHVPRDLRAVSSRANRFKLPVGGLWLCDYGMPTVVKFPASDDIRVQFRLAGSGATTIRNRTIAITEMQACAASDAGEVHFGPDFRQLAWRVPRAALRQKIAAMTGRPVIGELCFDPEIDLSRPLAATMRRVLDCLIQAIDAVPDAPPGPLLAELEQALIVAFLTAHEPGMRGMLDRRAPGAAPWQVRRAEEYIEANWDKPLLIEDLVAATGASARSLFRTFRQSRGCSPLEFARRTRLEAARRMLETPERPTTVTEIAVSCGFRDLGHFTKSFRQAFGELPSAVLNRALQARRPAS